MVGSSLGCHSSGQKAALVSLEKSYKLEATASILNLGNTSKDV